MVERAATCPGRPSNLLGFWLLGLLNNLAYVIMLSAAHDLLQAQHLQSDNSTVPTAVANSSTEGRDCNKVSTGTILLADIAPAVLVKAVAPFLSVRTGVRVVLVAILSGLSFLLAALAPGPGLLYLGVVCASLSSGLGEVSLLAHTHAFPGQAVIAAWSSGTGASGVLGAGSYAALAALGARPRTALLAMLWVPGALLLAFWGLLAPSSSTPPAPEGLEPLLEGDGSGEEEAEVPTEAPPVSPLAFAEKLQLTRGLLKYMIPLGLVYFFEYLINQGLYELVYYPGAWLDHGAQYRAYQLTYQFGVLISRSSLPFLVIRRISLLAGLQLVTFLLFLLQARYWLVPPAPGLTLTLALVLWEGLLGGAAYVNTFHRVSVEARDSTREFSLGISSLADSASIGLAGIAAIPLHNWICLQPV